MTLFGRHLKKLRNEKGLTLLALAEKVGTYKGYLCMIETGSVNPPGPGMTRRLAKILGASKDDLLLLAWAEKAPMEIREAVFDKFDLERKFAP